MGWTRHRDCIEMLKEFLPHPRMEDFCAKLGFVIIGCFGEKKGSTFFI